MCRLRFWCRLCWWMLWITWYTIVSWHSPYYFKLRFYHHKLATLLFGACLSSLLFHPTEEVGYVGPACGILSGPSSNALLLLSDTPPGFYPLHTMIPSWLLSPFFSEPHRIDQPVAYCPACLPALSSSLIFLPTSSLPISYHASIFIGSSPGFLVFREVPTLLNFFNLSHLLTRWLLSLNALAASLALLNIARTILYSFLCLFLVRLYVSFQSFTRSLYSLYPWGQRNGFFRCMTVGRWANVPAGDVFPAGPGPLS